MEGYRKILRKQILELKVVNTAVRSRVTVSDDEVKTYYKQNEKLVGGRSPVAPAADPRGGAGSRQRRRCGDEEARGARR